MKISNLVLPGIALGGAALLLWPTDSQGFTLIGGSLSLAERDGRIFNNFSDASANNNTTPDSNWPGYTGAPMSIWKAMGEWGSQPHGGTGAGDPLQPVGDGGANFDSAWAGLATGVGGTNDNIHSEIGGSSGGVLAFTETPISNGWRIRYYQSWLWQDGPGSVTSGIDIQGVATHEYGHALGLGHSSSPGATMAPSISGSGTAARSIAADDIAGVQFIYGVASLTKPSITAIFQGSGTLTIDGVNFADTNNEIWFTPLNPTGGTSPLVKVLGVSAQNGGTQIVVNIPADAGPGDVFVKSGNGTGGAFLSNGFPSDVTPPAGCTPPSIYCTGKVNSQFCQPIIASSGTPSATDPTPFDISCSQVINNKFGLLFYGTNGPLGAPFQGGFLCVKAPTVRTTTQGSGGSPTGADCTGTYSYDFNARIQSGADPDLIQGATVNAQYWYRDPNDPAGFTTGLSDGIQFEICP